MNPSLINTITNILGFILVIAEPIRSYLSTQPFSWETFLLCLGSAVIAYFTGKSTLSTLKK